MEQLKLILSQLIYDPVFSRECGIFFGASQAVAASPLPSPAQQLRRAVQHSPWRFARVQTTLTIPKPGQYY